MEKVYRINCGSTESCTDGKGQVWAPDQGFSESKTVAREKTLPIHNTAAPEMYRTERYGMDCYTLAAEPGVYTVRLHFAETFDCNFQAGERSFDVSINGRPIVKDFDPYRAAGGFARPVVIEYAGCSATDQISIDFTKGAAICGIEIFKAAPETSEEIRQITPTATSNFIGKRQGAAPDAKRLKILFIGNSMTFFWAIPESLQAMLEVGTSNLRIEPHRSLHGGKWLEYHYNETDALELIQNGDFDFVILQEYSKQLDTPKQFEEYAEKFNVAIRASSAKPLLYAQPGRYNTTDEERLKFMQQCMDVGKQIDAPIIPVCETLRLCYAERPDIVWHNADAVHMGMHGGYAVACTFYAALTGGADFPPPAILVQQVGIDPELATFIQKKAKQAVEMYYKF